MKKGVDGVEGVEAVLYRVPETLSSEVLEQMKAPPKDPSIPDIREAADLVEADGILFGFPTRYGSMAESWVRKEEGKEEGGKRKPAAAVGGWCRMIVLTVRKRKRKPEKGERTQGFGSRIG
ncbi:Probable NAD(P)H dehydrogenase (quinone) FQR1-like 2 [Linum perenne]